MPFFLEAQAGRICLNSRNELVDPLREKWLVKGSKLLAGHFLWGEPDWMVFVCGPRNSKNGGKAHNIFHSLALVLFLLFCMHDLRLL